MNSEKNKLPEGWSTFFLVAGMVMSVAWAISSARWVDNLEIIEWAAVAGLVAGILLAKTRFPALLLNIA